MKYSHVKVPLIMQMEYVECGAASLAMILAYYGKYVPLEQVRRDCGVSRHGARASNLITAAENYGMIADGYRYSVESCMTKVHYPCIIHWNMAHFVVLCGFGKGKAFLNDPALGERTVSMEEFNRSFTGIVLEFAPGENFVKDGRRPSVPGYLHDRASRSRQGMAFVILMALATAIIGLQVPMYQRGFTDLILESRQYWAGSFLGALALLGVLELVTDILREAYIYRIQGEMAVRSNILFFRHLLSLPIDFFQQRSPGDLISRISMNSTIAELLVRKIDPVVVQLLMVVFYFGALALHSLPVALLAGGALAANIAVTWYAARFTLQSQQQRMNSQMQMDATMISGIDMIETIKSAGVGSGYFVRWAAQQAVVNQGKTKENDIMSCLSGLSVFLMDLTNALVLAGASWQLIHGRTTVGVILVLQSLVQKLIVPARDLSETGRSVRELRTSIEKVEDVMSFQEDTAFPVQELPEREDLQRLQGGIAFCGVDFGYSRVHEPILKNVSFSIRPGERVAIVGSSGSGKSTVAKLLMGTVLPWAGEVRFDGQDRFSIPEPLFADNVSIVSQESTLFDDTVSNNIRMWDMSITSPDVIRAARDAQIHDDIMFLSNGYEHRIQSGGKNFSGGQCQRFAIARALAKDPSILIMDEATSALDAMTEHLVMEAVKARHITTVIVAHRLSTVRDCDRIIVLANGKIVEQGTHQELIDRQGEYFRLVSSQ